MCNLTELHKFYTEQSRKKKEKLVFVLLLPRFGACHSRKSSDCVKRTQLKDIHGDFKSIINRFALRWQHQTPETETTTVSVVRLSFCTCAYKTGAATLDEIIIVRQDEGAPLLHLQAIVSAGDSLTALPLGGLEVLRTQPGLINHLGGGDREKGEAGAGEGVSGEQVRAGRRGGQRGHG